MKKSELKKLIKEQYKKACPSSLHEYYDENDPVLQTVRARKDIHNYERESNIERNKQNAADARWADKYEKENDDRWRKNMDLSLSLKDQLDDLYNEREQLEIDMEQEAEPEGGSVADTYGNRLMDIERQIEDINSKLEDVEYELTLESKSSKEDQLKVDYDALEKAEIDSMSEGFFPTEDHGQGYGSDENENDLSFINKGRAKASLRQKTSGNRDDGMGKFTSIIYGIDDDGNKHEIKSNGDIDKYSKWALGENQYENESDDEKLFVAVKNLRGDLGVIKKGEVFVSNSKVYKQDNELDGDYDVIFVELANPNYEYYEELEPIDFKNTFRPFDPDMDRRQVKKLQKWGHLDESESPLISSKNKIADAIESSNIPDSEFTPQSKSAVVSFIRDSAPNEFYLKKLVKILNDNGITLTLDPISEPKNTPTKHREPDFNPYETSTFKPTKGYMGSDETDG